MPFVKPFNALRYNLNTPQDLGNFIVPPYDMLDSKMIDSFYNKNEYNAVKITQSKALPEDKENRDRHKRAAKLIQEWIKNSIIKQDEEPSLYIYEQTFTIDYAGKVQTFTRTGVIGLVKLVDFEEGIVLPHEYTLSGPKQDRYELLEETKTDMGQIFGLLQDSGDAFEKIRSLRQDSPIGITTDNLGVEHKLYKCSDKAKLEEFCQLVKDRTVLIADGHHRYETALKFYRDTKKEQNAFVMMTLVSMADPGLIVRPFHRLIRKAESPRVDLLKELSKYFTIQELGKVTSEMIRSFLAGAPDSQMIFIQSGTQVAYSLKLSNHGEHFLAQAVPEKSTLWQHLDVSKINLICINGILGLPLDGRVLHDLVEYVNDAEAGVNTLKDDKEFFGGFFIRPLSIKTIQDIVQSGERMPQKSTNFYPKLFSGLVFNQLG